MVGCVISVCCRFRDVPEDYCGCGVRLDEEGVNLQVIQESPGVRTVRYFHGGLVSYKKRCLVGLVSRKMFLAECGRRGGEEA